MHQPKYTRGRRAARALGLTRNPLRRRVDRLERTLRLVSVLTLLSVVVASALSVLSAYHRNLAQVRAERSRLQQVPVVLLDGVSSGHTAAGSVSPAPVPGVPATWTLPDGTVQTGNVYAPPVSGAEGAQVLVWMDADYQPVHPPADPAELRFRALSTVLGCISLFGLLIWGGYEWGRSRLDARRDADWTREWLFYERQWRDRLH